MIGIIDSPALVVALGLLLPFPILGLFYFFYPLTTTWETNHEDRSTIASHDPLDAGQPSPRR